MDGRPLTIKEAARHFGVSERTIRRRIAAGELQARRVPMAQGYQVFVYLGDNHESANDNLDTPSVMLDDILDNKVGVQVDNAALLKALDHIRQLEQEKTQLAGQVGFLQAKLQDAEERIRLLEAPKEPEEAVSTKVETHAPHPGPEPPSEPRSPLWQWVRRKLSRT